jgi:Na+(H+)/acetate symporter ActP
MHIEVDKAFAVACYSYLGCLLVTLLWYRVRRSRIARCILGLLILLPAILCMAIGIAALSSAGFHTGVDAKALIILIATVTCMLGMFLAFLALRLFRRPATPQKTEGV